MQARANELQVQLQEATQAQQLAERERAGLQQQVAGMQAQVSCSTVLNLTLCDCVTAPSSALLVPTQLLVTVHVLHSAMTNLLCCTRQSPAFAVGPSQLEHAVSGGQVAELGKLRDSLAAGAADRARLESAAEGMQAQASSLHPFLCCCTQEAAPCLATKGLTSQQAVK